MSSSKYLLHTLFYTTDSTASYFTKWSKIWNRQQDREVHVNSSIIRWLCQDGLYLCGFQPQGGALDPRLLRVQFQQCFHSALYLWHPFFLKMDNKSKEAQMCVKYSVLHIEYYFLKCQDETLVEVNLPCWTQMQLAGWMHLCIAGSGSGAWL